MTASVWAPSDRTSRLISRVAPSATAAELAGRHVELVVDKWTPDVEVAVALTTTLLLRLDEYAPVLHLCAPKTRNRQLPRLSDLPLLDAIGNEHRGFSSVDRLTGDEAAAAPDVRLVFGGASGGICVNAAGWRVSLGERGIDGVGNAVAAAFAGVLAAADAFQALLADFGAKTRRFTGTFSLWDLASDGIDGPSLPSELDLDRVAFAACGGVASGAVWTLGLLPLTGKPLLVDPDSIDDEGTNLNRHLTAALRDVGRPKAELAADVLKAAGAEPIPKAQPWDATVGEFEVVLTSPDQDVVRRAVQLSLPRWLLNAGTNDDGMYTVSRHDFLHDACLACVARSDLIDASPVAAAARRVGLSEDDLTAHLTSDQPLPDDVIKAARRLTSEERVQLATIPGHEVLRHVCGTLRPTPRAPAVSAPMLSAAPGVLLATDLVRLRLGYAMRSSTTMASILAGPHARWTFVRRKATGCLCTDDVYRDHFRRKWRLSGEDAPGRAACESV